LREDFPDQPVPFLAIIAQQYTTGDQFDFSAFDLFTRERAGATDFRARYPELERQLLGNFSHFLGTHPDAKWLHWRFPFNELRRRYGWRELPEIDISESRCFDLANYLKVRYGDCYVPDPRLWHAIRINLGGESGAVPGVLSDESLASAWRTGSYALLHTNTATRVSSIARLFSRVLDGTFQTAPVERPETDSRSHPIWSHGAGSYSVDRDDPVRVTAEEDNVLTVFAEQSVPRALTGPELEAASGCEERLPCDRRPEGQIQRTIRRRDPRARRQEERRRLLRPGQTTAEARRTHPVTIPYPSGIQRRSDAPIMGYGHRTPLRTRRPLRAPRSARPRRHSAAPRRDRRRARPRFSFCSAPPCA